MLEGGKKLTNHWHHYRGLVTRRSIIVGSILIGICVLLFGTHWRWMRKLAKAEA
jgi:hypothetical protein